MRHIILIFIGSLSFLTSCQINENFDVPNDEKHQKLVIDIKEMLTKYYNTVSLDSRSIEEIKIGDIKKELYQYTKDTLLKVKEDDVDFEGYDRFTIYTTSFSIGENKGFSIITNEPSYKRVLFFSPEGCLEDTAFNVGLRMLVDIIPFSVADILSKKTDIKTRDGNTFLLRPLVTKKWGQEIPYNYYAKACGCFLCQQRGNRNPIGCVATAVAQALSVLGSFNGGFYGNNNLDFSLIPNKWNLMDSIQSLMAAQLFHEIALSCQMKFDCRGSVTTFKAAKNYLTELGHICIYRSGSVNNDDLFLSLAGGRPFIMGGKTPGASVGHAWIIDGLRRDGDDYDYHCNWGWDGSGNGWSFSNPFTTNPISVNGISHYYQFLNNLEHINITE